MITHTELPGTLCDWLEDFHKKRSHNLADGDRRHFCKAIHWFTNLFRPRAVHLSPEYTANEMDSILMLHAGKWMFAELLRIAWNKDRKVIAERLPT